MVRQTQISWMAIGLRGLRLGALALVSGLALVCPSTAQRVFMQMQVPNLATPGQAGVGAGVYVRDSAIAMERLALAQRMERAREWGKSADVYQEILDKYPDRVVPSAEDPLTHVVQHYTSVTQTVREALCRWPAEGLTVYRSRYETAAMQLLNGSGDRQNRLHEILSKYFPTDTAKAAGIELMDLYFEQGDYAAANQIGKELLQWHPNLEAERPMVLFRTALAAKLSAQNDDANRWLKELQARYPQALGVVRGQSVVLATSLAGELANATLVKGQSTDSWQTVGGDETRGKSSASTVKPGARLYTVALMRFNWNQIPDSPNRQQMQSTDDDQRKKGAGLGIMPAVDKGQLFFQDNTHVYALDLDSGTPLAAWVETYPMENGAYKAPGNFPPVPLGKQLCVSVNDKYVTAVMNLSDPLGQVPSPPNQDSRLVCLDRKSGRELWAFAPEDFPEAQMALRELHMGGSPLMVGDNVYIILHGIRGQFEDCYTVCFSLASGKFRWATFIANSNTSGGISSFGDESTFFAEPISHIAYAGGRLFVVTNIGAIAALDAFTGQIDWLNIYRTDNNGQAMNAINPALMRALNAQQAGNGLSITAAVPWIYNPAIVQDGKVFALPNDIHSLFVYDAGDGSVLKQIPLADSDLQETRDPNGSYVPDTPSTLLGVRDDMVYLAGSRQVWQVPWREISPDRKTDDIPGYWRSADSPEQVPQVRGRAFVTADAVYLPTQQCIKRILLSTGLLDAANSSFPKNNWEEGKEGPGNVIVTQDHVIVAGDTQVAVYTDIALAKVKLDREVADAPNDPDARLHYAEVMFAAAQPDVAQARLEEAFGLLGGEQSLRPGSSRDRAFNDALSFATRSAQKDGNPQQIERFFDLARAAALSPGQQVGYRLARADFIWTRPNRDAGAAIELYQEILGQQSYRNVSMPDPLTAGSSHAGAVAEKAIQKILQTSDGQLAFKKFEEAAQAKLEAARNAGDPDALLEVARAYPDSPTTAQAMMAAADLYESRGKPQSATLVLRQLLLNSRDLDRVPILEALARNYLKMPGHLDAAVARLQSAAKLAPGAMLSHPLTLPNGGAVENASLASACDGLMRYEAQASLESLPDFHLPTHDQANAYRAAMGQWAKPFQPETAAAKINGVDAMVVPMEGFARKDRIIAWSAQSGLAVYAVGQDKPLFGCAAINQSPGGAAWTSDGLLVWSFGLIAQIDDKSGAAKWSVELSTLPAIVSAADQASDGPAAGPEEVSFVQPVSGRVMITTTTGRLLSIDTAVGRVAWQLRTGAAVNTLLANDDFTVIRYQNGQAIELEVYNTLTGDLLGKKSFGMETGLYPINMALAADGTLVYTLPNQLCLQDLFGANMSPQSMEPDKIVDATPPNTAAVFQGAGQPEPDQLLIHSGRIFALASSGKEVRVYSLETGDLWTYHNDRTTTSGVFPTESTSANVRLRISGNYLFVFSPRNLIAYRLDPPTEQWESDPDATKSTNYQQMLFGRDYLALVDRPSAPLSESNRAGNKLTLSFFLRGAKSLRDKEAGLLIFTVDLSVAENNVAIQPVEGGMAYFTGHSIQTFLGARDTLTTSPPG